MNEFYFVVNKATNTEVSHNSLNAAVAAFGHRVKETEAALTYLFGEKLTPEEVILSARNLYCIKKINYVREEKILESADILRMELKDE